MRYDKEYHDDRFTQIVQKGGVLKKKVWLSHLFVSNVTKKNGEME